MTITTPYSPDFAARDPLPQVDKNFPNRWSPRAFKKTDITESTIATILDAARWAPSCFNAQPWRFFTSTTSSFNTFLQLLVGPNQIWAKNAGLLGFLVAKKEFEHNDKPNNMAIFDCGAAWMSLCMQASMLGLHTHGMAGIHYDAIYDAFDIDKTKFEVVMGFAIGIMDVPESLPDKLRENELPSPRKPLQEIWQQL